MPTVLEKPGLNLLSAPGNDLVAATALAAAGAQIVLFSTGRGTPFACPVPTVKIASNPTLAQRKRNWIDFSAAPALEGVSIEQLGEAHLPQGTGRGRWRAGEERGSRLP